MNLDEVKDRLKIYLFSAFVRAVDFVGAFGVLTKFVLRYVEVVDKGEKSPYNEDFDQRKKTILVLDYQRFRGDVDIFSEDDRLRILVISWGVLRYLLTSFVYEPTRAEILARQSPVGIRWDFAKAAPGSKIHKQRTKYRKFLNKFLPLLLNRMRVDLVMNSDFRYRREADITAVASKHGFPHICYYREAMYIVPAYYDLAVDRHRDFGKFQGDMIAVQNSITKQMFVESGFASEAMIEVRGCPRMDKYIEQVRRIDVQKIHKRIAFFSCPKGGQLKDLSYFEFMSNTLEVIDALTRFALAHPDVEVVFKMKDMHLDQLKQIKQQISTVIRDRKVCNIRIVTDRMGAQDLLLSSDVVIAMQSTVVLEAAIAKRLVILPHFDAMSSKFGADQILMYSDMYDLFERARDGDDLQEKIARFYSNGGIGIENYNRIIAEFEKHVSSMDGQSSARSIDMLVNYSG